MKITDDFLAKRTSEIINNSCSASFDLLRQEAERQQKQLYDLVCPENQLFKKEAERQRKQIYDLVQPDKHLLKQISSAGMVKAPYADSMAVAGINQNALDALSPYAASVRLAAEMTNQKAISALSFNTTKAIEQVMGFSLASETAKLSRNSVADIEKRLFLNSAAELERQLFPFQDYSRTNSGFYAPSDSFVIRSSPKTSRQEERLKESKRRDEAENSSISTHEQPDYQAVVFAIAKKEGVPLPASEDDEPMFFERFCQMLENKKPRGKKEEDNGPKKPKRCQLHEFIWRVYIALCEKAKKPTWRTVKAEIIKNYQHYDDDSIIQEVTEHGISWRSKHYYEPSFQWSALPPTITKCKQKYSQQVLE